MQPLQMSVFCEMVTISAAALNRLLPTDCSLRSLETYVFCHQRLYLDSSLSGNAIVCPSATSSISLCILSPATVFRFASSRECYCLPFSDFFNFVVYNHSIKVRFVYFHVCSTSFWSRRSPAAAILFTSTSFRMWHIKALFQKFISLSAYVGH